MHSIDRLVLALAAAIVLAGLPKWVTAPAQHTAAFMAMTNPGLLQADVQTAQLLFPEKPGCQPR